MKLLTCTIIICAFLLAAVSVDAQSPAPALSPQSPAQTLILKMLAAEKNLAISGEQQTILYRPEQTFSAALLIDRQGDRGLRIEYRSPQAVQGEVYVDNGKIAWHFIPSASKLEVGISGLGRFRHEASNILHRLNNQSLDAEIVGHESIAGKNAQIVQVTSQQHQWGQHKYWIDPASGAQLKIQTFGTEGQLVSETYFTKISYNTKFDHNEFGPPRVDASVTIVPMTPRGSQLIPALPNPAQCGFPPMLPAYIPNGFTFQSTLLMPSHGQKMIGLNYENALVSLSIFERPVNAPPGSTPHNEAYSPRQGVYIAVLNGYQYILVGSVPIDIMQRIVQSMH